jgi:heme A synthase
MDLPALHTIVARAFSAFTLIVTLLAAYRLIRRERLGPDFWGAVVIGEGLVALQAILGIALLVMGGQPARGEIHYLYGVLTLLSWPAAWSYARNQEDRETLIWMLVSAFLFALSLRATLTGAG